MAHAHYTYIKASTLLLDFETEAKKKMIEVDLPHISPYTLSFEKKRLYEIESTII